jgi:hypothetical protein
VAAHFALLFLSLALWWAIGAVIGLGWSALIVGVAWAAVPPSSRRLDGPRSSPSVVWRVPPTRSRKSPDALKGNEDTA